MSSKQDINLSVERLEKLKQATILTSLETIDLDNEMDLYDTMIHLFARGELDKDFSSVVFIDMDDEQKKKIHELARKYLSLYFFAGNPNYWSDSIEGYSLNNLDFICMRIFDNYNFLLKLIKNGKLDVLEELKAIQKTDLFSNKVIIDYLRGSFDDDEILEEILTDFVDKNGEYYNLSDYEKALLVLNPEGILYKNDNSKRKISALELKEKIAKYSGTSKEEISNITLADFIHKLDDLSYQEIITNIYLDYMMSEDNLKLYEKVNSFH